MKNPPNPMQPFVRNQEVVRFKANEIVRDLLDAATNREQFDMNRIAMNTARGNYTQDDYAQFCQLIGYSLCGYHELSLLNDKQCLDASKAAQAQGFEAEGCRDNGCPIHTKGNENED